MTTSTVTASHFTVASACHRLRSFARTECATVENARMRTQCTNTNGVWTSLSSQEERIQVFNAI